MSSLVIGFNSYVDIAICMVIQQSNYRNLRQPVSKQGEDKETQESTSDSIDTTFETSPRDLLRLEWSDRIKEWQRLYPDNGPRVENWTSLKEFEFGAFFLQHPVSAMSLWTAMQTFYALDHFVCCTSKESQDRVTEWESMPPFEYLEASRVEKRWRASLQNMRKEIENEDSDNAPLPRMHFGVKKLEDACEDLRRNMNEHLKGVELADSMLKQIEVAARRRFSMIEKYLMLDESHSGGKDAGKAVKIVTGPNKSTSDFTSEKANTSVSEEPRTFKPLTRTKSIDVIKKHLLIAWASTKKGEATLSAVVFLIILIIFLYQIQAYLVIVPGS